MKIIAGLGNPGRSYLKHRHNAGFMAVDLLAERHGIEVAKRSFGALIGSGSMLGHAVLLAKPQTYMNLSGDSIGPLVGFYKAAPEELIVVHDDLDIELGQLKVQRGAGPGGHNGVSSIIGALGASDFCRVRIGIGRPPAGVDPADYVLAPFDGAEDGAALEAIGRAADAVEVLLAEGLSAAQQEFHR